MKAHLKPTWMLAAMFLLGAISGFAIAAGLAWHHLPPPGMPTGAQVIERVRKHLKSDLALTPAQEQQIEPILEQHRVTVDRIRAETLGKILEAIKTKNAAISQFLTPEQRTKQEQNEAERLKRFSPPEPVPK